MLDAVELRWVNKRSGGDSDFRCFSLRVQLQKWTHAQVR